MKKHIFIIISFLLISSIAQKEELPPGHNKFEEKLLENDGGLFSKFKTIYDEAKRKIENVPNTVTKIGYAVGNKAKTLPSVLSKEFSQIGEKIKAIPQGVSKQVDSIGSQVKGLYGKINDVFSLKKSENKIARTPRNETPKDSDGKNEKQESESPPNFPHQQSQDLEIKQRVVSVSNSNVGFKETSGNLNLKKTIHKEIITDYKKDIDKSQIELPSDESHGFFASISQGYRKIKNFSVEIISKINNWNNKIIPNIPQKATQTFTSLRNKLTNLIPNKTSTRITNIKKRLNETTSSLLGGLGLLGRKIKSLPTSLGQSLSQLNFEQVKLLPFKLYQNINNLVIKTNQSGLFNGTSNILQKTKLRMTKSFNSMVEEWKRLFPFFANKSFDNFENIVAQTSQKISEQIQKIKLKINIANFMQLFNSIGSNLSKIPNRFLKVFASMFDLWKTVAQNFFSNLVNQVSFLGRGLWNLLNGSFTFLEIHTFGLLKSFGKLFYEIGQFITNVFYGLTKWIKSWFSILIIILVLLAFLYFMPSALFIIKIFGTIFVNLMSGSFEVLSFFSGILGFLAKLSFRSKKDKSLKEEARNEEFASSTRLNERKKVSKEFIPRHGDQRFYGYFKCPECDASWESRNTFEDSPQKCPECETRVFPYCQIKLLNHSEKNKILKQGDDNVEYHRNMNSSSHKKKKD